MFTTIVDRRVSLRDKIRLFIANHIPVFKKTVYALQLEHEERIKALTIDTAKYYNNRILLYCKAIESFVPDNIDVDWRIRDNVCVLRINTDILSNEDAVLEVTAHHISRVVYTDIMEYKEKQINI